MSLIELKSADLVFKIQRERRIKDIIIPGSNAEDAGKNTRRFLSRENGLRIRKPSMSQLRPITS